MWKKVENLNQYRCSNDYNDKELKFKKFKLRLEILSYITDKELFAKIFGYTFEALANKLINSTNKEENQMIVEKFKENKEKLYEKDETSPFDDWVIQPSDWHIDLKDAIHLILEFNEKIQLDRD